MEEIFAWGELNYVSGQERPYKVNYRFEGSVSNIDLGSTPGSKHKFYTWFQSSTSTCSRFGIAKFAKSNGSFRRC